MKLDTTRPILLAACDVAAIVGKLQPIADGTLAVHSDEPGAETWRAPERVQEVLRVLAHAQTPDYSANLELPDCLRDDRPRKRLDAGIKYDREGENVPG